MVLARQQHILTFDIILRYIPRPEDNIVALDELFMRCMDEKVEVLEEAPPETFEDETAIDDGDDLDRVLQSEPGIDDPLRLYLREIGRISLLTAREETQLAQQLERGDLAAARLRSDGF